MLDKQSTVRRRLVSMRWVVLGSIVTLMSSLMAPGLSFSVAHRNVGRGMRKQTQMWGQSTSYDKVIVALTREDGKNGKLYEALMSHPRLINAIQLEELPCIAHADGPDLELLGDVLGREASWDYVAVTSPEAARVLAGSWDVVRDSPPDVAAVGKATQETLEKFGIPVAFCPSKATAKTLVKELPAKGDQTSVLYPASSKAQTTLQDGLSERGFDVTRLNTYDTVTATWTTEQKEMASRISVTCFGSPSAINGWLKNSGDNQDVLAACIGETSATACRKHEWLEDRIFYPNKPGVPGWADAVADALDSIRVAHA